MVNSSLLIVLAYTLTLIPYTLYLIPFLLTTYNSKLKTHLGAVNSSNSGQRLFPPSVVVQCLATLPTHILQLLLSVGQPLFCRIYIEQFDKPLKRFKYGFYS